MMIRVDTGNDLRELLLRAVQLGTDARLDVAVPFYDTDSENWRLLVAAADAGSRVRLLTRPGQDALHEELLRELVHNGVRVVHLPRLHAKAFLLSHKACCHSAGWVGSHNFTNASESSAQELGVAFRGRGRLEYCLLQQALMQLDAWEQEGQRRIHNSA